jgi:hypothetical protein
MLDLKDCGYWFNNIYVITTCIYWNSHSLTEIVAEHIYLMIRYSVFFLFLVCSFFSFGLGISCVFVFTFYRRRFIYLFLFDVFSLSFSYLIVVLKLTFFSTQDLNDCLCNNISHLWFTWLFQNVIIVSFMFFNRALTYLFKEWQFGPKGW